MADLIGQRAGDLVAVVGDRPSTDGQLARRLGVPFALVLSGVTSADGREDGTGRPAGDPPAAVADDFRSLVRQAGIG
jgi:ribonucleotide monophosphatase NagD (HAD superfamily)